MDKPSPVQKFFCETAIQMIGTTVEKYGFVRQRREVGQYSTTLIYRKGKRYIKISSTNYPTDYPYYYNILLGHGDSDNFFEADWNAIALWQLARTIDPFTTIVSYDFPFGEDVLPSIQQANADLLKYGENFLKGKLATFHVARKSVNQKRQPYKIYSPDKDGNYSVTIEPKSAENKDKFS